MHKETKQERMIRIFSESAAQAKSEEAAGAHLRGAVAAAILEVLKEGCLITDLDCFRNDPRYTGNDPRVELLFKKYRHAPGRHHFCSRSETAPKDYFLVYIKYF